MVSFEVGSARVRQESWDEGKKKRNEGGGGRERRERLPATHDFEKLRSPTNAAFDWCGAGSVD